MCGLEGNIAFSEFCELVKQQSLKLLKSIYLFQIFDLIKKYRKDLISKLLLQKYQRMETKDSQEIPTVISFRILYSYSEFNITYLRQQLETS